MTGDELIERFESGTISADEFHHADHVRLAFEYLRRCPVLEALEKFSAALKRFAEAQGKARLYHETITWAYLFLIRERMERASGSQTWEEFAAGNHDLLIWERDRTGVLGRYYTPETLASEMARTTFVLPDRDARSV